MKNKNCDINVSTKYKIKDYFANTFMYTFNDYLENPNTLKKFKVYQLKIVAKKLNLHITGKKNILIQRIKEYYSKTFLAIKLQKIYRGYIIRKSILIRGPALNNRTLCVNNNDGFSLEPISEIPYERFYSYCDSANFIYGFDVVYLIIQLKKKGKILNPFSMNLFNDSNVKDILILEKVIKKSYSYILDKEEIDTLNQTSKHCQNNTSVRNNSSSIVENNRPQIPHQTQLLEDLNIRINELRSLSINQRIENLFIEIDLLGNYTTSNWFKNLTVLELSRFFNCLYDIWHFRAQISSEIKSKICYLNDPFLLNVSRNVTNINSIKEHCVFVMENLIHYGIDTEHRQLGALYVLSALTVVSIPARINMNWLYEAII